MVPPKSSIGEISSNISSSPEVAGTLRSPVARASSTRVRQASFPSSQSKLSVWSPSRSGACSGSRILANDTRPVAASLTLAEEGVREAAKGCPSLRLCVHTALDTPHPWWAKGVQSAQIASLIERTIQVQLARIVPTRPARVVRASPRCCGSSELLQAEGGQGPHLLDDLDLLVADRVEDDVEGVLLLDLFLGGGGRAGNCDRRGGGSGDLERLLELLHELGEFDEGELLESLDELVGGELRHGGIPSCGSATRVALCLCRGRSGLGSLLLAQGFDGAHGLRGGRSEDVGSLEQGGLEDPGSLGKQNVTGLELGKLEDFVGRECPAFEDATLDDELRIRLGEVLERLGRHRRLTADEGQGDRANEQLGDPTDACLLGRDGRKSVLRHGVGRGSAERTAQLLELADAQAAVLGQQDSGRLAEQVREFGNRGCLVGPRHGLSFRWVALVKGPYNGKAPAQAHGAMRATFTCAGSDDGLCPTEVGDQRSWASSTIPGRSPPRQTARPGRDPPGRCPFSHRTGGWPGPRGDRAIEPGDQEAASSLRRLRVFVGSTGMPGPIVVDMVALRT